MPGTFNSQISGGHKYPSEWDSDHHNLLNFKEHIHFQTYKWLFLGRFILSALSIRPSMTEQKEAWVWVIIYKALAGIQGLTFLLTECT